MKAAAAFAGACAAGVPIWWLLLFASPEVRVLFVPANAWPAFRAVALPDLLLAVATGALAEQLFRGRALERWCGLVCGAWGYATAYAVAWAFAAQAPWLGPVLMLVALSGLAAIWYAVVSTRSSGLR